MFLRLPFRGRVVAALLIVSFGVPVRAQTTLLWPEVDVFARLNDKARLHFLGATVHDGSQALEGEFGADVDVYVAPIRKRKHWALFRLDQAKNQILMLRVGYHYLPSFTGERSAEDRGVLEATARYPLLGGVLISDRNRVDFRFIGSEYSWRYRNRLSAEQEFSLGPFRLNPYARGEIYYDSRFEKWAKIEFVVGAAIPLTRHFELEGYFDYQKDISSSPHQQMQAAGVEMNLYF